MAHERKLIDLEKAIETVNKNIWWNESEKAAIRVLLRKVPTVEAEPVVRGRWEKVGRITLGMLTEPEQFYKCSVCGGGEFNATKYCPNCGARMEG